VTDVVVIGAGPNGLVAANLLADAGLEVVVCEEQPGPGGAVRSDELTLPGFVHDVCSAFYPFAVASPVMRALELERHGLTWRRAPLVLAHPTPEGPTAVLSQDPEETAASLEDFAAGDGAAWLRLTKIWERIEEPFMDAFTTPFPPVRAAARLVAATRLNGALELARIGLTPVRRLGDEQFNGPGGTLLLAGNALHADLTPETPASALFGLILCGIGQRHGFPVPEGGAGRLTDALVARLEAAGGEVRCGERVERVSVEHGRAVGVRLAGGDTIPARRAVLADVGAPQLYDELLAGCPEVPARTRRQLARFQYDNSTIKLDWALDGPVPWSSPEARRAGTVHVAESLDLLSESTGLLERQIIPARPFLIFGQYGMTDPTRSPPGTETAWAYSHVPQHARGDAGGELTGRWDRDELERFAQRMEAEVERLAPGFAKRITARSVLGPRELEAHDRNLVGGALNGGTSKLHQQLVFRPFPGAGRPETPIGALLLASASAHPGGGVHGAPGAIAAAALLHRLRPRLLRKARPSPAG
jgi:phytoene dehydrogenase-like protein